MVLRHSQQPHAGNVAHCYVTREEFVDKEERQAFDEDNAMLDALTSHGDSKAVRCMFIPQEIKNKFLIRSD